MRPVLDLDAKTTVHSRMARVPVKPELIRWARERAGLGVRDLARRFPKLREWEEGQTKATAAPVGYLFLSEPPDEPLPIPDFRTVGGTGIPRPSPNLLDTIFLMQRRQEWMHEFLVEEGAEPLAFVGSAREERDVEAVARRMRATLGIDGEWAEDRKSWSDALRVLRLHAEDAGILVVINGVVGNNTHRPLRVEEFRGFVLLDDLAPLVFVNGADGKAAQMFTLAHELAHVWVGQEGIFDLEDLLPSDHAVERFCDRIAAEFLVPEASLRAIWPAVRASSDPLQEVALRFKVSRIVAARRALDLRLIDRDTFLEFYRNYQSEVRKKPKSSGGDFYATQEVRVGRRFGSALVQAAREGRVLYHDAFELSGLYGRSCDRYARSLETGPPQ
jgi:Zn-dependent peptidase ImmA (M78 family)